MEFELGSFDIDFTLPGDMLTDAIVVPQLDSVPEVPELSPEIPSKLTDNLGRLSIEQVTEYPGERPAEDSSPDEEALNYDAVEPEETILEDEAEEIEKPEEEGFDEQPKAERQKRSTTMSEDLGDAAMLLIYATTSIPADEIMAA